MKQLITVALPIGSGYGWGNCGKYFTSGLTAHFDVRLLCPEQRLQDVHRAFDDAQLPHPQEIIASEKFTAPWHCNDSLVLTCCGTQKFEPLYQVRGKMTGALFFQETTLHAQNWARFHAHNPWDFLIAGSEWNQSLIPDIGIPVYNCWQGVDERVFYPNPKRVQGQFRVFSGGKFEYRKAQDVVLAAFAKFCAKNPDVNAKLVTAWHNPWPATAQTMAQSRVVNFKDSRDTMIPQFTRLVASRLGIATCQMEQHGKLSDVKMAEVMNSCDVAIFPNRCEGGTNLVLGEAIACGLPVIAAATTGQSHIAARYASYPVSAHLGPQEARDTAGVHLGHWPEPDVERYVSMLCQAYANRGAEPRANMSFIEQHSWPKRSDKLAAILRDVMRCE